LTVWLNGSLVAAAEARIDPADRGFLLGDGLFETLRAEDGRVSRLDRHLARLRRAAQALDLPLLPDDASLGQALAETLAANGLGRGGAALRLTLTRGAGPRGLLPPEKATPTLMVAAFALPPPRPPARAVIARTVRRNEGSLTSRLKVLGYLDNILALREAQGAGADEAILLNGAGRLACASAANLFLVSGGRLLTPPPDEGVLPGVTRGRLIELAGGLGIACIERPLAVEEIGRADEAFLSSSLSLVRPVARIGRPMPAPGPLTARLAEALLADRS
jgi:branched-chain amino acid aminotransferase